MINNSDKFPDNPELVHNPVLQLDPYKSVGLDEIHLSMLEELADIILRPLSMIFEWSWESRKVSVNWQLANIVPVFKEGKSYDPGNYRLSLQYLVKLLR